MSSSYRQVQWAMIALLTLSQSKAGCTSMDIAKSYWEFSNFVQILTIPPKVSLVEVSQAASRRSCISNMIPWWLSSGRFSACTSPVSLSEHLWIVYSEAVNGAFYVSCAIKHHRFWGFFMQIARTIPVTSCRCENSSQHLYARINKEKLAGTPPNSLWCICRPGQGGGLHCLVSSMLTILCWVASFCLNIMNASTQHVS